MTYIGGPINGRHFLIAVRQELVNLTSTTPSVTSGLLPVATSLVAGIIPSYASFCTAAARYSSVCSCVGYLGTTTVTAPAVTLTSTETSTSSSTWTSIPPVTTVAPTCTSWEITCGFTCANLLIDNANCRSCGNACPSGQLCGQGTCVDLNIFSCTRPEDGSFSKCSGSCNGYCFPDVNSNGYCKKSQVCPGLQVCAKGKDCASSIGLVNGCGQVYVTVSVLCTNTSSAKTLFAKRVIGESLNKRELVMSEIGEMVK